MGEIEPDVLAAAHLMRERFGEDAPSEIELRIIELREQGEGQAASFWQQVHDAVDKLGWTGSSPTKH